MNTFFVLLMWLGVYYLIFHPLNEEEWIGYLWDDIFREHAEGYDGSWAKDEQSKMAGPS
jgi:hypothetical protein